MRQPNQHGMYIEKSLASKLEIGPVHKKETALKGIADKAVLSASIFAAMVLVATTDLKPASQISKTFSQGIIKKAHPASDLESRDINYRFLPDKSKRELADHIATTWKVGYIRANQVIKMADDAAYQANVDPLIVLAVMAKESGFDPAAKSKVGAEGLMQVWRKWHPEKFHGIKKATPAQNVVIGSAILKEYLDIEGGSLAAALQRYNGAQKDQTMRYASEVLTIKSTFDSIHFSHQDNKALTRKS